MTFFQNWHSMRSQITFFCNLQDFVFYLCLKWVAKSRPTNGKVSWMSLCEGGSHQIYSLLVSVPVFKGPFWAIHLLLFLKTLSHTCKYSICSAVSVLHPEIDSNKDTISAWKIQTNRYETKIFAEVTKKKKYEQNITEIAYWFVEHERSIMSYRP